MKKQIQFIIRYFTQTRRWRRWINLQTVTILVLSALFMSAMVWFTPSTPLGRAASNTATPAALQATAQPGPPTRTPLPPEYQHNANQTVGIAFAGAALVLIIVMGVALFSPREEEK